MIATAISLTLANSYLGEPLQHFLHSASLGLSVERWVNDGLMVIFFLMIVLELEREIYVGELSSWKNAALPIIATVGGMCVPAFVHFLFNIGATTHAGAGIPMATDIAFSLGVLALFSKEVASAPASIALSSRSGHIAHFRFSEYCHTIVWRLVLAAF